MLGKQNEEDSEAKSLKSTDLFGDIPQVSLTWKHICYTVMNADSNGNDIDILRGISGYLLQGKILTIVGPPGAGKTTLLQILSGCLDPTDGNVFYNGRIKRHTCDDVFNQDIMGYHCNAACIPYNVRLHGSLTVRETLYYAAELKCVNMSKTDLDTKVDILLRYLGLSQCSNKPIGNLFFKGINEGEKRRVAIGCELITPTSLLFMDEPLTGLDDTSAYVLLSIMHGLAMLGHSIVLTVRQPKSRMFDLLCEWQDYLMILERGRLMYFGLCHRSINFFDRIGCNVPKYTNPFDYYLDIVNSDFIQNVRLSQLHTSTINSISDDIHKHCRELLLPSIMKNIEIVHHKFLASNMPTYHSEPNDLWTQIKVLTKRNFMNHLRNPSSYIFRILVYCGIALVCSLLLINNTDDNNNDSFKSDSDVNDRLRFLFAINSFLPFLAVSQAPLLSEEREIYIRERMNGHHHTLGYVIAHFVARSVWLLTAALAVALIVGLTIEYDNNLAWDWFLIFVFNLFLLLSIADSLMVMICAVVCVDFEKQNRMKMGLVTAAVIQTVFVLTSGLLRPHDMLIVFTPFHYISFHTYSLQIFVKNEFHGLNYNDGIDSGSVSVSDSVRYADTEDVLQEWNMKHANIWVNFSVLIVMNLFYEFMFFWGLKYLNRTDKSKDKSKK